MKRTITVAAALLVMQIALAVALNITGGRSADVSPAAPLFSFAPEAATTLEIAGPAGEKLTITKTDAGWILPARFNAPASADQVSSLLGKLAGLKQGLAVATSEEAAKRFKVAETGFERHVLVKKGEETLADLYVGTSPAFRQIHARKAGAREIFTAALNTFELEPAADKWLDKNVLRLGKEEMAELVFPDFTLQQKDKAWQLADVEQGKETAKEAADELVNTVGNLTIQDVMDPGEAAKLFGGEAALSFTVKLKNGTGLDYRFVQQDKDNFLVKRSDRELYGKVHAIQVENLKKYSKEKLLKQATPAAGKIEEGGGPKEETATPPASGESGGPQTPAPAENPARQ